MGKEQSEKDAEAARKILGEPVFIAPDEQTQKSKRNLVVLTSTIIIYKLLGAEVTSFQPLGVTIPKGNGVYIDGALWVMLIYFGVHYLWHIWDSVLEWRNRFTGCNVLFQTGSSFASNDKDYPSDPRQSSLMTWWSEQSNVLHHSMKGWIEQIQGYMDRYREDNNRYKELRDTLDAAADALKKHELFFSSDRIPMSLYRYERWLSLFHWSQLLRFGVFEIATPIALWGASAILMRYDVQTIQGCFVV